MNHFAGLFIFITLLFLDASVWALRCGQGTRVETVITDFITIENSQCEDPTHMCHRFDVTATVLGQGGKISKSIILSNKYYSIVHFKYRN